MSRPFLIGVVSSALIGAVSVGVKGLITRYPGIGDIIVFSILPPVLQEGGRGRLSLAVTKAVLAVLVFVVGYWLIPGSEKKKGAVSAAIAIACMLAMSFGRLVVA
jgi:hypothetical protein